MTAEDENLHKSAGRRAYYYENVAMGEDDCEELAKNIVDIAESYHQSKLQALKEDVEADEQAVEDAAYAYRQKEYSGFLPPNSGSVGRMIRKAFKAGAEWKNKH